jgi:hypothetical protein
MTSAPFKVFDDSSGEYSAAAWAHQSTSDNIFEALHES